MSEYKFLDVTTVAQEGLESLDESLVKAFCIPRDFISSFIAYVRFAYTGELDGTVPYLGIHRVSSGERVGVGRAGTVCPTPEGAAYKFLTYKLDKVLDTTTDDEPGFIFAFYNGFPPAKYTEGYSAQLVGMALVNGGAIKETLDTAWCRTVTEGISTQFPYIEFSALESSECGTDEIPMNELGTFIVSVLGKAAFYGTVSYSDAGVLGSDLAHDGWIPQAHGSAVPLSRSMLPGEAWDNLIARKFKTLYSGDGWIELLSFELPSNWVWDSTCSIIPDNNTYTLCGRVHNGQLEWQFGNLVTDATSSHDESEEERIEWNPNTGKWEVVGGSTGESGSNDLVDPSVGILEMVTPDKSSFSEPVLKWAGKQVSERNMLLNGKLRASCEPVYLGMFNITSSYLAGIEYTVTEDSECEDCTPDDIPVSYYEAKPEVSPVWFLFASTKDDMINLVAIEHKLNSGDSYGSVRLASAVTDPYQLYGVPPKIIDKRMMGVPPGSYSYFKQWLYTSFILPQDEYIVHITQDSNSELLEVVGDEEGYYYDTGNGYLRIADELIESGCRRTPCPRWMQEHSIIDNENILSVDIPLCTFVADKDPVMYDGSSKGYRGFIDNVNDHEYLWQRINGKLEYLPYNESNYVNDISRVDGILTQTTAYLPIGSRFSKSYASYTNFALKISSAGRCLKFERTFTTVEGSEDSIINNQYVLSAPGSIIYTSTVFERINTAPTEVNDIALASGTLLAYDTVPVMNIDKVVVFDDDIGDGVIAITPQATLQDYPNKPVLMYTTASFKPSGDNDSNVLPDGTLHDAIVSQGFIVGTGTVSDGTEFREYTFTDGTIEKTTYNGTLALQGVTQLGGSVSYTSRASRTLDLTSFTNVVADQALLIPHDNTIELNTLTVPNSSICIVGYPDSTNEVVSAGAGEFTEVCYVTSNIYAIDHTLASDNSKVLGSVIDIETLRGLYYYLLQNNYNDLSNWPAVVLGQGNGYTPDGAALLTHTESVGNNKYQLNRKIDFQLVNRPRYNNQYAAIYYPTAKTSSYEPEATLYFETDAEYPISYSVWEYNVGQEGEERSCVIQETTLEAGQHKVEVELPLFERIQQYTPGATGSFGGYVVVFVTRGATDKGGSIATVRNLTWMHKLDTRSGGSDMNRQLHGAQHSININKLELDEAGVFRFECDTSAEDSLHVGKLIGTGIFDSIADSSKVTIDDTSEFEGIYVPRSNTTLPVLGKNSSLAAVHDYTTSSANVSDYYLDCLYVSNSVSFNPGIPVYVNRAVLSDDSAAGYLSIIYNEEEESTTVTDEPIDVNVVSLGSVSISSYIPGGKAISRGTIYSESKVFIWENADRPMYVLPDLSVGLDMFELVPSGVSVTTDGSVISDGESYRYLFKSTADTGSSLVEISAEVYAILSEDNVFIKKQGDTFTTSVVFKVPADYSPEDYTRDNTYEDLMESLKITENSCTHDRSAQGVPLEDLLGDNTMATQNYIDRVDDPTNSCYVVESTTISCCTPKPTDCCETDPDNCDKNCGSLPPIDPYPPSNIDPGGDDEEDDDTIIFPPIIPSKPGGGGGGGTPTPSKGYTRLNDVYVYYSGDKSLLKEVFTDSVAKIVAVRGGTASKDRKTFTLNLKSCTFSFAKVTASNVGTQTSGNPNPGTIKLIARITGGVDLSLSRTTVSYRYPAENDKCKDGYMQYGLRYVDHDAAKDISSIEVCFNSNEMGNPIGWPSQSMNIPKTTTLDVSVKISDTFTLTPNTGANKGLTNRLDAMGLKWEETGVKMKRIYDGDTNVIAKIRYIQIVRKNSFESRLMYTAGLQLSKEQKYAGRATPEKNNFIFIGSTGEPSTGTNVTASRGQLGDFVIPFGNGEGMNKMAKALSLTLNPTIIGYTPFEVSFITATLINASWRYCNGDKVSEERATGTKTGSIMVNFDIVSK